MSVSSAAEVRIVNDRSDLIAWFQAACVSADALLIGLEHEKPPFYLKDGAPVPYQAEAGVPDIKALFNKMARQGGWKRIREGKNVVALRRTHLNWTLEPGGQLETGGAPLKNVHQSAKETDRVIGESVRAASALGLGLLALGYHPTHEGKDLPMMPRSRYAALRTYAENAHIAHGIDGLFCTSAAQVNLGYTSEADMVKKLRVALALQPVVTALFANSPFAKGAPTGYQSYRSHVMHNYMGGRCGFMLPVAFEKNFGFDRFVDYALDEMPLMGIYEDGVFIDTGGGTFRELMEGRLPACPGRRATIADWENHLNTIWPEVRLRRTLEMRGADNGPPEMIKALAALWTGILYDTQSLDSAYHMIQGWTNADREYLRENVPRTALQTPFAQGTVQDLAKNMLTLADAGLKRRAIKNAKGEDESVYLGPLHSIVESGITQAQRLCYAYEREWKRDISPVFGACAYCCSNLKKPPQGTKQPKQ